MFRRARCIAVVVALQIALLQSATVAQAPVEDLECVRDCGTFAVTLTWTLGDTYDSIEIRRDGLTIETLSGTSTTAVDTPPRDTYDYEVIGAVAGSGTAIACSIGSLTGPYPDHIILALEGSGGAVDSVAALEAELIARGDSYVIVTDVEQLPCSLVPGPPTIVWSMTGTFPDHTPLDEDTGAWLAQHVAAGGGVYHEGSDSWTIDPPTAFSSVDGIQDGASTVGDDSLVALHGSGLFDGMDAGYTQDQPGDDGNDQLVVLDAFAPSDIAGGVASAEWQDGGESYVVGVYYATAPPFGNVFVQSFELGGYQGALGPVVDDIITGVVGRCVRISGLSCAATPDTIDISWSVEPAIVTRVALTIVEPDGAESLVVWEGSEITEDMQYTQPVSTEGPYTFTFESACGASDGRSTSCLIYIRTRHVRGDANVDGGVNIADGIDILTKLFTATGEFFPCDNAADTNNDGSIDIGDVVYVLSVLFTPGAPPIPPPFPECGVDAEHDVTCDSYDACPP